MVRGEAGTQSLAEIKRSWRWTRGHEEIHHDENGDATDQ